MYVYTLVMINVSNTSMYTYIMCTYVYSSCMWKLVFTMRECYQCISDHGKIIVQLVMLSRPFPI